MYKLSQLLILSFILFSCDTESKVVPVNGTKTEVKDVTLSSEDITGDKEQGRDSWQQPELVLNKMGELKGQKVADIGAYFGYFTFILAHRGAEVVAIDIDNEMLKFIRETASKQGNPIFKENIDYRLVKPDDPGLKMEEVDQVLLVNMMGYLDNRSDYLQKLRSGLKPGGQFNIVDFKMKRLPQTFDIPRDERVYADIIEEELHQIGLENIVIDDTSLEYQYIITANKPKSDATN